MFVGRFRGQQSGSRRRNVTAEWTTVGVAGAQCQRAAQLLEFSCRCACADARYHAGGFESPKTLAHAIHRPDNDDQDTYIGIDVSMRGVTASQSQLSLGAPVAISNYIANKGDDTSWKERLTANAKTFAVPVTIAKGNSLTVGDGSPISQMKIFATDAIAAVPVPAQSCSDVAKSVAGVIKADLIAAVTPPKPLGNLSVNAYVESEGKVALHFCNPTLSSVQVPEGKYTVLAIH